MKITKFVLLLSLLLSINLYGASKKLVQELHYEISYTEALQKAQESNKPLMMVIGIEECPWCNKFEIKTLTHDTIVTIVEKNFIALSVLKGKDTYPEKFDFKGVPVVVFIDPKTQEAFYKTFGYKSKREYKTDLENALELFTQKYN